MNQAITLRVALNIYKIKMPKVWNTENIILWLAKIIKQQRNPPRTNPPKLLDQYKDKPPINENPILSLSTFTPTNKQTITRNKKKKKIPQIQTRQDKLSLYPFVLSPPIIFIFSFTKNNFLFQEKDFNRAFLASCSAHSIQSKQCIWLVLSALHEAKNCYGKFFTPLPWTEHIITIHTCNKLSPHLVFLNELRETCFIELYMLCNLGYSPACFQHPFFFF